MTIADEHKELLDKDVTLTSAILQHKDKEYTKLSF